MIFFFFCCGGLAALRSRDVCQPSALCHNSQVKKGIHLSLQLAVESILTWWRCEGVTSVRVCVRAYTVYDLFSNLISNWAHYIDCRMLKCSSILNIVRDIFFKLVSMKMLFLSFLNDNIVFWEYLQGLCVDVILVYSLIFSLRSQRLTPKDHKHITFMF